MPFFYETFGFLRTTPRRPAQVREDIDFQALTYNFQGLAQLQPPPWALWPMVRANTTKHAGQMTAPITFSEATEKELSAMNGTFRDAQTESRINEIYKYNLPVMHTTADGTGTLVISFPTVRPVRTLDTPNVATLFGLRRGETLPGRIVKQAAAGGGLPLAISIPLPDGTGAWECECSGQDGAALLFCEDARSTKIEWAEHFTARTADTISRMCDFIDAAFAHPPPIEVLCGGENVVPLGYFARESPSRTTAQIRDYFDGMRGGAYSDSTQNQGVATPRPTYAIDDKVDVLVDGEYKPCTVTGLPSGADPAARGIVARFASITTLDVDSTSLFSWGSTRLYLQPGELVRIRGHYRVGDTIEVVENGTVYKHGAITDVSGAGRFQYEGGGEITPAEYHTIYESGTFARSEHARPPRV